MCLYFVLHLLSSLSHTYTPSHSLWMVCRALSTARLFHSYYQLNGYAFAIPFVADWAKLSFVFVAKPNFVRAHGSFLWNSFIGFIFLPLIDTELNVLLRCIWHAIRFLLFSHRSTLMWIAKLILFTRFIIRCIPRHVRRICRVFSLPSFQLNEII